MYNIPFNIPGFICPILSRLVYYVSHKEFKYSYSPVTNITPYKPYTHTKKAIQIYECPHGRQDVNKLRIQDLVYFIYCLCT